MASEMSGPSNQAAESVSGAASLRTPAQALSRHLVLYDGECSFCSFQMKLLTWLDWFGVLRLAPISDPDAVRHADGVSPDALFEAMHCVTRQGRIFRGARCIRFVGMRLPLLIPLALVLWIPGVIHIAEWVYRGISRNRYWISRLFGCKEACAILPSRRSHDRGPEKLGRR